MVKVFQLNDCDWVAAETLDEATQWYRDRSGVDYETVDDPWELSDEDMDRLQFHETDDNDRFLEKISFRVALARRLAEGWQAPFLFASTEH